MASLAVSRQLRSGVQPGRYPTRSSFATGGIVPLLPGLHNSVHTKE